MNYIFSNMYALNINTRIHIKSSKYILYIHIIFKVNITVKLTVSRELIFKISSLKGPLISGKE